MSIRMFILYTGIIFHGQTSLLLCALGRIAAARECIGNVRVITFLAMKSHGDPLSAASIPCLEKSSCYMSPGRCHVVIFSGIFFFTLNYFQFQTHRAYRLDSMPAKNSYLVNSVWHIADLKLSDMLRKFQWMRKFS